MPVSTLPPTGDVRRTSWGTIAQAAARFGCSRDTIRRMISRGEIYAERFGPRLIRVDLDSVQTRPLGPAA